MFLGRTRSALRYLSWADPFYKWKFSKGDCPSCGGKYFLSLKRSDFMTRCLTCKANIVNISLIPVIKQHFGNSASNAVAYELSTYGSTLSYLQNNFRSVTTSEYMPDQPKGAVVDGVRNEDIQSLTFDEDTFDLVTSNSVLEHVPDDIKGCSECYRILKPKGALIFSVPLYDTPSTIKMAEIDKNGSIVFHQEPEYHDSRLGGPESALTFWRHSFHDICERVKAAGFSNVRLVDVTIAPSQGLSTKVVYAIKD
ncbi:methyltransferase domain-containing protein [Chromobacterium phragmitis]|uniref:class I SAM-dependent methyltransferase n=1 Tax=Chromobacterium amazonense TaxID=1382803 RepID=UPI0021B735DC|nr:class I SAM-dependent methyltransferase [Chromobacterium amazonense]MBM2886678.1 methyltransferase domain-containing protein [Chromobacterium amazonense]MDE1715419.1 methyltransferase domain-containing protein [Chromobacterium amazonense]